jgi:ubiquitin carboxyl-terminal hydrolase 25/28
VSLEAAIKLDLLNSFRTRSLFYGLQRQHLTYTPANATEPTTTTKDEEFSHFLINPRPEIRSSLDETFETTHVTFEGTEAEKEHGLLKAPPVLTLVVNRVQYNRDLQRPFKDQTFMRFTDTLQLARYSNANLVRAKEVRKKEAELKVELKALEEKLAAAKKGEMGEGAPVTDVQTLLNESLDYLMSDPFDMGTATAATPTLADHVSDVVTMITEEQSRVTSAVGDIEMEIGRKKLELEKVWIEVDTADGTNEHDYTLHAVFMHRGELVASSGPVFFSVLIVPGRYRRSNLWPLLDLHAGSQGRSLVQIQRLVREPDSRERGFQEPRRSDGPYRQRLLPCLCSIGRFATVGERQSAR